MNKNLDAYVFKIKDFLNDEDRNSILEELENVSWVKHTFYNYEGEKHSYDDDLEIFSGHNKSSEILMPKVWKAIQSYIDNYNFPWFGSWNGYSSIKYNRYSMNQTMHMHWDGITTLFDGERKGIPTLSVVGLLNDDYEGGEFIMFDEEHELKIDAGEVIIFPSNFLYPHYVKPVTKGTRYSFVSWVW